MKRLFPSLPAEATLADVYAAFPEKMAPLAPYLNAVMRGPGALSVADRELIAAYVSGLNACAYCHGAHIAHARAFGVAPELIEALAADPGTAPVEDRLRPLLAYVAKLTHTPSRMTDADAAEVYAAGWSEAALFDAIQVCAAFNLMNRILEGTGVDRYHLDPCALDEAALDTRRSDDAYLDFARASGVDV